MYFRAAYALLLSSASVMESSGRQTGELGKVSGGEMMEHLLESRMIDHLWDGAALNEHEAAHLARCASCQGQVAIFQAMQHELVVARAATVSEAAEDALVAVFTQAREQQPRGLEKLLAGIGEWVSGALLWDSRKAAVGGVRNGSVNGGAASAQYRLLFGAHGTEIELLVEAHNGLRRITGEVMVAETGGSSGMALIELMPSAEAKYAIETQSDHSGRFALEQVPPGNYVLTVTSRLSQTIVIAPLELT